jgi:(2Fe-2S) ferredoxin
VPGYRRHFFVCTNRRSGDSPLPSCAPHGAEHVLAALRQARDVYRLAGSVFVTEAQCLGMCPKEGTTVVVYPEGVWYRVVTDADVRAVVDDHMVGGRVVDRLRDPSWRPVP